MNLLTRLIVLLSLVLTLTACGVNPPKPAQGDYAPIPASEPSILPIEVAVETSLVKNIFESELPTGHGNGGVFFMTGERMGCCDIQLGVHRSGPVNLSVDKNSLNWTVPLAINSGRVDWSERLLFATVRHHEEFGGGFNLAGTTNLSFNPDWSIGAETNLSYSYTERPWITVSAGPFSTSISIGSRVGDAINGKIQSAAATIDQTIEEALTAEKVRPPLEAAWSQAHQTIKISEEPSVWLQAQPVGMGFGGFSSQDGRIVARPELSANIKIVAGNKPGDLSVSPFPENAIVSPDSSFRVDLPLRLPNREASRLAKERLVGTQLELPGGVGFEIRGAEVFTVSSQQIAAKIKFKANNVPGKAFGLSGHLYFVGLPQLDTDSLVITVSDFDFHVDTKNELVDAAAVLLNEQIREAIQKELVFNLNEEYQALRSLIDSELTSRPIAEGLTASVSLTSLEAVEMYPQQDAVFVRVQLSGSAIVSLSEGFDF